MIATIFCCNAKRGRFQTDLYPTDKVLSYFPKRTYGCVTPPGTVYSNCHSSNVIYPIQCLKCEMLYVAETAQNLYEGVK